MDFIFISDIAVGSAFHVKSNRHLTDSMGELFIIGGTIDSGVDMKYIKIVLTDAISNIYYKLDQMRRQSITSQFTFRKQSLSVSDTETHDFYTIDGENEVITLT